MAILRPRMLDSSVSGSPSSSCPRNRTEPLTRAAAGSRPITASEVTDLPEPDSPTIPSTSPGATGSSARARPCTRPSSLGKDTVRSLTSSTGRRRVASSRRSGSLTDASPCCLPPAWTLGSSASRSPSPTKLTASTVTTSSPPGTGTATGRSSADRVPAAISVPSETSGGCTPNPKKDRPVSARIAPPTLIVASMISSEAMLGTMCRKMILAEARP